MAEKIKQNILLLILLATATLLCVTNYTPNTILSGWDTLHPEFNFRLSFERELPGVFRANQGLGTVAAHSDMADLPHILILFFLSFLLPMEFLRYSFFFLTLIFGTLGMYVFLNKIVIKNKIASFLGALFYLLNLGTMQQFVVPFEMFATQFATLPWLFFFATNYILRNEKNDLIFLTLTIFLSAPMAFAATLWYFQFLVFVLYLLVLNFSEFLKKNFAVVKKVFIVIALTLLLNLFWILPNIYYALNFGENVVNASINKLFSKEAFLYNKEFGNLKDLSLLKNFLFGWSAYSGNGNFVNLLDPWITHLKRPFVEPIGFSFTIMALLGLIFAINYRNKIAIALLGPIILSLFFLINDNPPTAFIYNFFKNNIPLFGEAFRFPQNKVIGIFVFAMSVYFAFFQLALIRLLDFLASFNSKIKFAYVLFIIFLIFYFMSPAFFGNFISPYMRIKIPNEYFQLFDYFEKQDKTARIANLPIHSHWGWEYYQWNGNSINKTPSFQGAGFIWFGIEQPLLNRDFDRWDPANEQYYREMSNAIYSKDSDKLINVLQKYNITYILVDKNIIAPEQRRNSRVLFFDQIELLLKENQAITRVASFGNLLVYKANFTILPTRIIKSPPAVAPKASASYDDFAYLKYKDYITYSDLKKNTVYYLYRNIIDNQNRIDAKILKAYLQNQKIAKDISKPEKLGNDCPQNTLVKPKKEILDGIVRYTSLEGAFCDHYSFTNLSRGEGYLISITSRNLSGLPLWLCVSNYLSGRCDLYTQLSPFSEFKEDVFLVPPIDEGALLDINFNNFGIRKSPSINELKSIEVIPFPYETLSQLENYNTLNSKNEANVLGFFQSFNSGWKAYEVKSDKKEVISWVQNIFPFLFGKELKEHVLVNNWANGWIISKSLIANPSSLIIIFWPQYLGYIGFLFLITTFLIVIIVSVKSRKEIR